jgi:hypothetical protein
MGKERITHSMVWHMQYILYIYGWPEPCTCTVYDRIFGDSPTKHTVHTPYIYGYGQPYLFNLQGRGHGMRTTRSENPCHKHFALTPA